MRVITGRVSVDLVSDGRFALDGGAMFGVVPKPLWSRVVDVDERNRIPLALNCLLIRSPEETVLVDTGIGHRWSEKERGIYAIRNRPGLIEALAGHGVEPGDVTIVVNTHLHFDHAGGNTVDLGGRSAPTFPNARYMVQRGEFEWAMRPTLRDRVSYVSDCFAPLHEQGRLELLDGDGEIAPGIRVKRLPGHTPHLQGVLVETDARTVLFPSDLVPTVQHLPYPWIMGYDLEPLETLRTKMDVLGQAAANGWVCIFQHEPVTPVGTIRIQDDRPVLDAWEDAR